MQIVELFQAVLSPLVVVHAVHTLKRDWAEAPTLPAKTERRLWVHVVALSALTAWGATQIAPAVYYTVECVHHLLPLLA